jgi:predicted dehydrogenase
MKEKKIGIIMNGVTGRMGTNQHLVRSILAIRKQGGLPLRDGSLLMPEPLLVGRSEEKLARLAAANGLTRWSTDLDAALADKANAIYFDSQLTETRAPSLEKAIKAGKAVYTEKPAGTSVQEVMGMYRLAKKQGVKHGVVQDKLWLPGIIKLKYLIDTGFFGRILSVRGEFGYWVFEGEFEPAQRPSWNYRKKDGGGIMMDMLCHWRYVIDKVFGPVKSLSTIGAIHHPKRWDEAGKPYAADAEDAAYSTFELESGLVCQFNSSWCTRVRRDDLLTIHVDGTKGSAVAGLRECFVQPDSATPRPVWNPDIESPINYFDNWMKMPARRPLDNAFKAQWELFLRHVAQDDPFPWDLLEGAKGVQLAELGLRSWKERRWLEVPKLEA